MGWAPSVRRCWHPTSWRRRSGEIRDLTERPFAVNLFAYQEDPEPADEAHAAMREHLAAHRAQLGLPDPDLPPPPALRAQLEAQLEVIAEARFPVFSFTFGIPALEAVRESEALLIGTATTTEEAAALEAAGVDAVVAQGSEAGGHRGAFLGPPGRSLVGLVALVPQVVDRVDLPVIAAGGIMDGRGIAAALALGADGVQLGTAFLVSDESTASDTHKRRVAASADDATTITDTCTGRDARAIRTPLIDELERSGLDVPPFPPQSMLTRPLHEAAAERDRDELMFMLSGQAGALARPGPTKEIMERLAREAEAAIERLAA
ncbi:MAG: NAD(P)H-dependent flavin oxidoreductase [Solirubrobacterales bacterium]